MGRGRGVIKKTKESQVSVLDTLLINRCCDRTTHHFQKYERESRLGDQFASKKQSSQFQKVPKFHLERW